MFEMLKWPMQRDKRQRAKEIRLICFNFIFLAQPPDVSARQEFSQPESKKNGNISVLIKYQLLPVARFLAATRCPASESLPVDQFTRCCPSPCLLAITGIPSGISYPVSPFASYCPSSRCPASKYCPSTRFPVFARHPDIEQCQLTHKVILCD